MGFNMREDEILIHVQGSENGFLDLSRRNLSDNDVICLAKILKMDTKINAIDLSDNYIGSDGVWNLVEALKVNRNIWNIKIEYNRIGIKGAEYLAELILSDVEYLRGHLRESRKLDIEQYNTIKRLDNIFKYLDSISIHHWEVLCSVNKIRPFFQELVKELKECDNHSFDGEIDDIFSGGNREILTSFQGRYEKKITKFSEILSENQVNEDSKSEKFSIKSSSKIA